MSLANVYMHMISINTYAYHCTYTYNALLCMHTTCLYCNIPLFFHVNGPFLHVYYLQQNTLQTDCLHVHVVYLCLLNGCPILSNITDFHNGPCYL